MLRALLRFGVLITGHLMVAGQTDFGAMVLHPDATGDLSGRDRWIESGRWRWIRSTAPAPNVPGRMVSGGLARGEILVPRRSPLSRRPG